MNTVGLKWVDRIIIAAIIQGAIITGMALEFPFFIQINYYELRIKNFQILK